jgi:hypothetical protein
MDHKTLRSFLLRRAEEMAPATEIHLWPVIQARLSARNWVFPSSTGRSKIITPIRGMAIIVPMVVVLFLVIVLGMATPQGQAFAQEVRSVFSRADSDQIQMPANPGPAAITPAAGISGGDELSGWAVFKPAWLPQGFAFSTIDYRPKTASIVQKYIYQHPIGMQAGYFYLGQQKTPFDDQWPVGQSARIEPVQIGAITGEYVVGAWDGDGDHQEWEAYPNYQHLRWETNGFYFNIDMINMGIDPADLANNPAYVSKEELISIANSLN